MQKTLAFIAFLMALAILGGGGALVYGVKTYVEPGPLTDDKTIIIERGTGVNGIAAMLAENKIIAHPYIFRIAARLTNKHTDLKAGEYEFPARANMATILGMLEQGLVVNHGITLREGLTSWQVVQIINATEKLEGTVTDIPLEGSLLPETYHFMTGDLRADKITEMQAAMTNTINELWETRRADLPFTTKAQAVTLASIVEKETGVPSERARIAGVFVNRLRAGMPLQTDPTVIYALTKGKIKDEGMGPLGRRLLSKDLAFDSPYNTYKYPGLPPGPICNPGRAALEATLNPETHEYIYFVADGTGGHAFAKTLAEHNANVAKWRKIRKEQE